MGIKEYFLGKQPEKLQSVLCIGQQRDIEKVNLINEFNSIRPDLKPGTTEYYSELRIYLDKKVSTCV